MEIIRVLLLSLFFLGFYIEVGDTVLLVGLLSGLILTIITLLSNGFKLKFSKSILIICFALLLFIISVYNSQFFDTEFRNIIIISILNIVICVNLNVSKKYFFNLIFTLYTINVFVMIFESITDTHLFFNKDLINRYSGLSSSGGSFLSFIYFLIYKSSRGGSKFFQILIKMFAVIGTILSGRFGLILIFIYFLIHSIKNFKQNIIIFGAILLVLVNIDLSRFNRSFELFINIYSKGEVQTKSSDNFALQIVNFFNDFQLSFFGNGNYGMRDAFNNLYVDSTFLRVLSGGGIFFIMLLLFIYYKSLKSTPLFFYMSYILFVFKEILIFQNPLLSFFTFKIYDKK